MVRVSPGVRRVSPRRCVRAGGGARGGAVGGFKSDLSLGGDYSRELNRPRPVSHGSTLTGRPGAHNGVAGKEWGGGDQRRGYYEGNV